MGQREKLTLKRSFLLGNQPLQLHVRELLSVFWSKSGCNNETSLGYIHNKEQLTRIEELTSRAAAIVNYNRAPCAILR
jgi:hypothetical protein